jgi:tetratricopeptide (TPR) repeat protein
MTAKRALSVLLAANLILAPCVLPAATGEQAFQRALANFQKYPDDAAARLKVIETAQGLPSPPEVPDSVSVLQGKAKYLMQTAKGVQDYQAVLDLYHQALNQAPWDANLYYDQAVVEEKADQYAAAKADFKLYLVASPDADDKSKVLERLGKLDVMQQQQDAATAQAAAAQAAAERQARLDAQAQPVRTAGSALFGAGILVSVIGGVGLIGGAVEMGTATGYSSPGVYDGVDYYKSFQGAYYSNASYQQYQSGQNVMTLSGVLLGGGLCLIIAGAVMKAYVPSGDGAPAAPKKEDDDSLLDYRDGRLSFGTGDLGLDAQGRLSGRILRAEF